MRLYAVVATNGFFTIGTARGRRVADGWLNDDGTLTWGEGERTPEREAAVRECRRGSFAVSFDEERRGRC